MARIRTIKPEFFKHEELYEAEKETKFPLRLAFAGLWCSCDREGRFKWRPNSLKLDIIPYDNCDFSRVLDALATRGFVVEYESDTGDRYGFVPSFLAHQVINNRESQSQLPCPFDASSTRDPRGLSMHKGKGKEGKGKEKEGNKESASSVASLLADYGIVGTLAKDFILLRSKKSAPITKTVLDGFQREADKAGISIIDAVTISIERNWQSFKAEWHQNQTVTTPQQKQPAISEAEINKAARPGESRDQVYRRLMASRDK